MTWRRGQQRWHRRHPVRMAILQTVREQSDKPVVFLPRLATSFAQPMTTAYSCVGGYGEYNLCLPSKASLIWLALAFGRGRSGVERRPDYRSASVRIPCMEAAQVSPSAPYCRGTSTRRPSRSTSCRRCPHLRRQPCWRCTGRGRYASGPCRRTRWRISDRPPSEKQRSRSP